jgi:hypothetical protein
VEFGSDFRKTLTSPKSRRVAIFFSPSPQGDEDEELYEKNAGMKEVDGVIISSIHRITGNEYFKRLFLRQSQNCFSARSAKEPSTRLWDFFAKNGRFSPLQWLKYIRRTIVLSDFFKFINFCYRFFNFL